jgi:hypothetical protein
MSAFVVVCGTIRLKSGHGRFYVLIHGGHTMVLLTPVADAHCDGVKVVTRSRQRDDQRDRIIEALGPLGDHLAGVDEKTLSRYYRYLTARLSFPFTAHYPAATTSLEDQQDRCTVLELLDPIIDMCDEFDGIFCKTQKGKFEINLPLIELEIPQDSPNFELIEDYWFWFWNWR